MVKGASPELMLNEISAFSFSHIGLFEEKFDKEGFSLIVIVKFGGNKLFGQILPPASTIFVIWIKLLPIDNKDEISLDVGVFKIVIPLNDAEADVEYGIPLIEKSISIVGSPCRPLNIISNGIPSQSSILLELTVIIGKGSTVTSTVALAGILVQLFPSVIEVIEIVTGLLLMS
jgi:hypothetical protein